MKSQKKNCSPFHNYTNAVIVFYKINDIVLNVKKIGKFMYENVRVKKDRAYTHDEILKLLEIADERDRVVILILASSGIRIGALPFLKMSNLDGNKLTIYENSKEEYFNFVTPECKKAIDSYSDMRLRYGEKITDDSYLIRDQFYIRNPGKPRHLTSNGFIRKLIDSSNKCGIRNYQVHLADGFRKFFTTQLINSKINSEIRETLLGHKIGLASAYYRPTEQQMYEEYQKVIDNLTIIEENRLRRKVETLTIEKSGLDRIEKKC